MLAVSTSQLLRDGENIICRELKKGPCLAPGRRLLSTLGGLTEAQVESDPGQTTLFRDWVLVTGASGL